MSKAVFDPEKVTFKHVSRLGDVCSQGGHVTHDSKGLISVETHVMYGNNWLFRVLGHCYNYSTNEQGSRIHIEYIETNAKLVKKLKIPFKKSKVIGWDKQESKQYNKEFNRYSIQACLGQVFLMKSVRKIADYWLQEHGIVIREMFGNRVTGVASRKSRYSVTSIKLTRD